MIEPEFEKFRFDFGKNSFVNFFLTFSLTIFDQSSSLVIITILSKSLGLDFKKNASR